MVLSQKYQASFIDGDIYSLMILMSLVLMFYHHCEMQKLACLLFVCFWIFYVVLVVPKIVIYIRLVSQIYLPLGFLSDGIKGVHCHTWPQYLLKESSPNYIADLACMCISLSRVYQQS